jgi:hypothetical protein
VRRFETDVSGRPICPIFKIEAAQEEGIAFLEDLAFNKPGVSVGTGLIWLRMRTVFIFCKRWTYT